MNQLLFIPLVISFLITIFSTYYWIKKAERFNLTGKDMHKKSEEKVAESGGINVILGFAIGVLIYIAIQTFYINSLTNLNEILVSLITILAISFMGFIDDIFGWKIGLSKRMRILFILVSAIPLSVINAGDSTMIGINFGLFYPLIIIPLAVLCCSVAFNTIAGYNGLETRQAIILLGALLLVNYSIGEKWLSFIILIMISSLIAFYIFNKNPAKVFPGNVLTYSLGAFIAIIAIFGNIEKIAVFFFIPYIIEVVLKLRGKLEKESYAKINEDGSLEMPYEKIYGLEHLSIWILKKIKPNKKVYENDIVLLINLFQIIIIISGFLIFKIPLNFN